MSASSAFKYPATLFTQRWKMFKLTEWSSAVSAAGLYPISTEIISLPGTQLLLVLN